MKLSLLLLYTSFAFASVPYQGSVPQRKYPSTYIDFTKKILECLENELNHTCLSVHTSEKVIKRINARTRLFKSCLTPRPSVTSFTKKDKNVTSEKVLHFQSGYLCLFERTEQGWKISKFEKETL